MEGLEAAVDLWGILWAVLAAWLLATRRRRGSLATASLLIVLGAGLLALEDPTLLLWMANATPSVDRDGVVGLVRPHTLDHMVGGAAWAFVALGAAAWAARTRLRRGELAAWWFLAIALLVGGGADLLGLVTIFSHGLPIPGPASAESGFGWIPIVVALIAWASGLALAWPAVRRQTAATAPTAGPAAEGDPA